MNTKRTSFKPVVRVLILAALLVGPMARLSYPLWRIFDRWLQPAR